MDYLGVGLFLFLVMLLDTVRMTEKQDQGTNHLEFRPERYSCRPQWMI